VGKNQGALDRDTEGVEGEGIGGFPPPQSTRGSGGASQAPPAGSGAEPRPKTVLVHFQLEKTHLMATNLTSFCILLMRKSSTCLVFRSFPCLPSGYATGWANTTKAEHLIIRLVTRAVELVYNA